MVQQYDFCVHCEALSVRHSMLGVAVPGETQAEQQIRLQKRAACQAAITDHQSRMVARCDEEIEALSSRAPSPTTGRAATYATKDDSERAFTRKVIEKAYPAPSRSPSRKASCRLEIVHGRVRMAAEDRGSDVVSEDAAQSLERVAVSAGG